MPREPSPYIDMWKDWEPAVRLLNADGSLATGLSGVTFRVALTEHGAAIGTLTDIAASEDGDDPAVYVGAVNLSTLTTQMPDNATYPHGKEVYVQVFKSGDIQSEAFRKTLRRKKYP